jgi:hypothetical protein
MAKGVFVSLNGFEDLKKRIGEAVNNYVPMLDVEMSEISNQFMNRAAEAAPVDTGFLKNHVTVNRLGQLSYEIVSGARYSAYVEFGTITHVKVPTGLEAYALQFKGRGIKKTGGMYPRPFFFPQVPIAKEELLKQSLRVLKELIK